MFYICALIMGFMLIASILTFVQLFHKFKICELLVGFMWRNLTPKLLTRVFFEINFELTICAYLQIKLLWSVKSGVDYFSCCLAILSALTCFLMPILSLVVICRLKSLDLLHDKRMKNYFGELYEM